MAESTNYVQLSLEIGACTNLQLVRTYKSSIYSTNEPNGRKYKNLIGVKKYCRET